jgi:NAD(P)-dependent dehydrogenase (short-subunit alcohol dehydrogenase family)
MSGPFTALVTGASTGIGADIAQRMLAQGWRVVGLSRRAPEWSHPNFAAKSVDLLDLVAVAKVASEIASEHPVTHIVHNAGLVWPNLIADVKADEVDGLMHLHVSAPLLLTQAVLPAMRERQFGRIVFVTSRAALGVPTRTAYSASKAAVHGMARTWALELGPEGVTVNVVAPGPVQTDNFWGIVDKGSDREDAIARQLPMRRLGTVADVSHAVLFFCAAEAGFITGQVLFVCGGGSVGSLTL